MSRNVFQDEYESASRVSGFASTDDGFDEENKGNEEKGRVGNLVEIMRDRKSTNLVLAALCLVGVVLVLTTYFLLKNGEKVEFETAFKIYARETTVVANMRSENVFGQLQSLASALRSDRGNTDSDQPEDGETQQQRLTHQLSIPDFDKWTEEIGDLTGIEMLMFAPFVPFNEREAYVDFQLRNQEWILESYEHRGWDTSNLQPIHRGIHNFTVPEALLKEDRRGYVDDGFMLEILANRTTPEHRYGCSAPVAQVGPRLTDTSLVMLDLLTHPIFKKEMVASLEYDVPVISELEDLEFLLENVLPPNGWEQVDYGLPRSFTLDPVKAGNQTIGFVVGVIRWNVFFEDFLPEETNGIVVRVESDCGKSFAYVLNGGKDDVWYLNASDVDVEYKHLEQRYKFFWKDHPKGTSRHCHFDLLITPSEDFSSYYKTNAPLKWAGIVWAVMALCGAIFLLYDYFNYKKQAQIAEEKKRAEAVVTSLFPEQIGQKLLEDQQRTSNAQKSQNEWQVQQEEQDKPLAELFPSASIYFADIAGFTAWSSDRPPSDVFQLLETIYHEFDAIANRRRVFKIETIGDCYVAVCGLPTRRDNHAAVMARFAQDCLTKFRELADTLEDELPGTAALALRTGLHSGPVTAGVLRGDRARFQLFGDTVNTTARMESNGKPHKIHVSKQFSIELMKLGKGSWTTQREDMIEAKGKGKLQTFWLNVPDHDGRGSICSSKNEQETASESVTESDAHPLQPSRRHSVGDTHKSQERSRQTDITQVFQERSKRTNIGVSDIGIKFDREVEV